MERELKGKTAGIGADGLSCPAVGKEAEESLHERLSVPLTG